MKISIVTPSYNQGDFIEDTIKSVLVQKYNNLEYIVMDGGSTDATVSILKKYQDHLAYWVSEKDNGQTHAINKGFSRATGDIIAWINSDDVYCPDSLAAVAKYFQDNPSCQWVAGNLLFMDKEGNVLFRKFPNSSKWLEKNAMLSVFQPNIFFRRSILESIGFPKEDFHMIMDLEWFCRIATKFSLHVIDQDIAKFRLHDNSKSWSDPNSSAKRKYQNETLHLVRTYHPKLDWATRRYPHTTFYLWLRVVKVMRILNRVRRNELAKLWDRGR